MDALDMARALEAVHRHADGGTVVNVSVLVEHADGSLVAYTADESLDVVATVVTNEQAVAEFTAAGDGITVVMEGGMTG